MTDTSDPRHVPPCHRIRAGKAPEPPKPVPSPADPVTPEMIDAAEAVGSADGLLWPICALSFVLTVVLSAAFA